MTYGAKHLRTSILEQAQSSISQLWVSLIIVLFKTKSSGLKTPKTVDGIYCLLITGPKVVWHLIGSSQV